MPKPIPTLGLTNWGQPLNEHLAQLNNPITGGINTFDTFSQRPTTLTAVDKGKTYLYTQTGNIHQWTGTNWKVLNESHINVKDFGAVGDGVVDDTAAVQAGINEAQTRSGIVFVPKGKYVTTQTLQVTESIKIIGTSSINSNLSPAVAFSTVSDVVGSVLLPQNGVNVCISVETNNSVIIENISLFGVSTSTSSAIELVGSNIVNIGSRIKNCRIQNFNIGINHKKATFAVIESNLIFACDTCIRIADEFNADSGDSTIISNTLQAVTHGILYESSGGLRVQNNKVFGGSVGFFQNFGDAFTVDLFITGNSFESYGGYAILMQSPIKVFADFIISNNQFAAYQGIDTVQAVIGINGKFSGGVISNNVIRGANQSSIYIDGLTDGVITGNRLFTSGGAASRAISLTTNCSNIKCNSNSEVGYILPNDYGNSLIGVSYKAAVTANLVGGFSYETIGISLPVGMFKNTPKFAMLQIADSTQFLDCYFNPNDGQNTNVLLRFVVKAGSGNITAATNYRFSLLVQDDSSLL
jgi:parallel beta-helix repeat protein